MGSQSAGCTTRADQSDVEGRRLRKGPHVVPEVPLQQDPLLKPVCGGHGKTAALHRRLRRTRSELRPRRACKRKVIPRFFTDLEL